MNYMYDFSLGGVGRYPGIPFDAGPAVVGDARPCSRERVGHDLDALGGVEADVCDDHVPGAGSDGKAERVPEPLGFDLHASIQYINATTKRAGNGIN